MWPKQDKTYSVHENFNINVSRKQLKLFLMLIRSTAFRLLLLHSYLCISFMSYPEECFARFTWESHIHIYQRKIRPIQFSLYFFLLIPPRQKEILLKRSKISRVTPTCHRKTLHCQGSRYKRTDARVGRAVFLLSTFSERYVHFSFNNTVGSKAFGNETVQERWSRANGKNKI